MPSKRRKAGRHIAAQVTGADERYLLTGEKGEPPCFAFFQPDHARALWQSERVRLLSSWISTRPGSRPWAWWKHDAPSHRLRLSGTGDPVTTQSALACGVPSLWFGVGGWQVPKGMKRVPVDPENPPVYESQANYLDRLGLFEPGERERLGPRDFADEVIVLTNGGNDR